MSRSRLVGTLDEDGRSSGMFHWHQLCASHDIAPDGRFLIIRSGQGDVGGGPASNLILVLNWHEELKRLVPVN